MDQPPNPYAAPRVADPSTGQLGLTSAELHAFLGARNSYYERAWTAANRTGGWRSGFNWAAAVFGSLWMLYRRMYLEGAVAFVLSLTLLWGIGLVNGLVFRSALGAAAIPVAWGGIAAAFGFLANPLYLRRARQVVKEVRAEPRGVDPFAALLRRGGVNWAAAGIGLVIEWAVLLVLRSVVVGAVASG